VPNINPTEPKIIKKGIIKLTAVKDVFPTKLDTKKPSTTPYTDVKTSITTEGKVKLNSFL